MVNPKEKHVCCASELVLSRLSALWKCYS